jgi:hypothetical protein
MESNGARNKIQCSQETATLLEEAGKLWTRPRENKIRAKGKGDLQTFWLDFHAGADYSKTGTRNSDESSEVTVHDDDEEDKWIKAGLRPKKDSQKHESLLDEKINRLVDWNTDVLARILRHIVARNRTTVEKRASATQATSARFVRKSHGATVLDEVVEVIELPELNMHAARQMDMYSDEVLDPKVLEQLRDFIRKIATMYQNNPFHNFEHVSANLRRNLDPAFVKTYSISPATNFFQFAS